MCFGSRVLVLVIGSEQGLQTCWRRMAARGRKCLHSTFRPTCAWVLRAFSFIGRYNSGTYNNQFMILDARLFVSQQKQAQRQNTSTKLPFPPNFLWVTEQMPGRMRAADVTNVLNEQVRVFDVGCVIVRVRVTGPATIVRIFRMVTHTWGV